MTGIFDAGESPPDRTQRQAVRPELPKRFYKDASVVVDGESFTVALDGRPLRTPARRALAVPSETLAGAVAEEWRAQGEHVDPATMPLTRLLNSAIDGVADQMEAVVGEIARYSGTDLLFYRAERPERLVARQAMFWDPIVAWGEQRFGVPLRRVQGVMHVRQEPELDLKVAAALPRDPLRLAALHTMTTITGSVLLAVAAAEGRISAAQAFEAANVDEDWNFEQWGGDEEALQRRAHRKGEIEAAARVLGL